MKKSIIYAVITLIVLTAPSTGKAQSVADCIRQLALNYQKLASMKSNLQQMYRGFDVLQQGYGLVRDVSKGNFSLHEGFLNGLLMVSPAVRNYPRAADIVKDQTSLMREYRTVSGKFLRDPHISPPVSAYIREVYDRLSRASSQTLDDLEVIMTNSKLRMSDAERLTAIDKLYSESISQLSFIRRFNDHAEKFAMQKSFDDNDKRSLKDLYGIK